MDRKEDKLVPCEETFNSVKFSNFPSYESESEGIYYISLDMTIAERVANKIPEELKSAVTINWSELDAEKYEQQIRSERVTQSPFSSKEEAEEYEDKVVRKLINEGFFGKNQ